jgi:hypothetical protein
LISRTRSTGIAAEEADIFKCNYLTLKNGKLEKLMLKEKDEIGPYDL